MAQFTVVPSPMSHTTRLTFPVTVTVTGPADGDSVIGPQVRGSGSSTHIHVGMPSKVRVSGPWGGVIPILIARRFTESMASSARVTGSTNTGAPAAPAAGAQNA